jgi:hypothetical protein
MNRIGRVGSTRSEAQIISEGRNEVPIILRSKIVTNGNGSITKWFTRPHLGLV